MDYPNFIELPFVHENPVNHQDSDEDKYPESLPRYFIEHFTEEKARVFDPFIGHGTTAFVAEELGRIPYGIEADKERFQWCAGQLEHWQNIRHGDAGDIQEFTFPKMDFCITSPPFMAITHQWNPLYSGDPNYHGYDVYLQKLSEIFTAIKPIMKRGSHLVVHVDNIAGKQFTPLVRDFSICISESFRPVGETIVKWTNAPENYPYTRVLIFKNTYPSILT